MKNTKENIAKIKSLKLVKETQWNGNTIHNNIDKCLRALNNDSANSGHYNPVATKINGLKGYFMINQDGSIFCEARIIKEDENKYRIEYISNDAWNNFENNFCKFISE